MSIEDYMRSREEFSEIAQRLKDMRKVIKQVSDALSWDPFSFSFTKNGNLLVDHAVKQNHIAFSESELWPSVEELTELSNSLNAKKVEMSTLYNGLPDAMQKVVQSPNDLLKSIREEVRR